MKLNFKNLTVLNKRIRLIPKGDNFEGASANIGVDNPTLDIDPETGIVSFCLTPIQNIISCVPTQIAIQLPSDFFVEPAEGRYCLTWNEIVNGVTVTKMSSLDYPVPGATYTYTALIGDLLREYSKPGNPVNGGRETELLGLFTTEDTDKFLGKDGARGSQPTTIQIIPTSLEDLGAGIDLYPYFMHPVTGAAPEPVHSCGYGVIAYEVTQN